jgi:hypothetical protein
MTSLPTPIDQIHAYMYASDRIKKEKCADPDILKKLPDIKWKPKESFRLYPCPKDLESCEHGDCVVTTEKQCNDLSKFPFNENDGSTLEVINCKEDADCKNMGAKAYCTQNKTCTSGETYLEWKTNIPGSSPKCVMGNSLMRRWCEYPVTRRPKHEHGTTDVPAFKYLPNTGECQITKKYCDWEGVSYKEENGRPTCYEKTGQKAGEFIMGKTIFRGLKQVVEGFSTIPNNVQKIADRKYAHKYQIVQKDYAGPGIHLYQIIWGPEANKIDQSTEKANTGFFADEIEKKYPEIVKTKNNCKFINIKRDNLQNNPFLKRIYIISGSGKWVGEIINNSLLRK